MANLAKSFVSSLATAWGAGYWVTWHPSVRLRLGDVGARNGLDFVPITTLAEQGMTAVSDGATTRDDLTWHSEGTVDVTYKLAGQTSQLFSGLTSAQAGALVEFSGKGGLLVAFRALAEARLANQPKLAEQLLRAYWGGSWQLGWAVVSHLVTAESGTVLGSSSGDSRVELNANAAVGPAGMRLAELAGEVSVARSTGLDLELVGSNLTPFFRVLGLRKLFLRGVEAAYGDTFPLRTGSGRPVDVPTELIEEARDEPDAVLEEIAQTETGEESDRL